MVEHRLGVSLRGENVSSRVPCVIQSLAERREEGGRKGEEGGEGGRREGLISNLEFLGLGCGKLALSMLFSYPSQ